MNIKQFVFLTLIAASTALISACSPDTPQALPAVNEANCAPEAIAKIKDKGTRQEFASQCVRRGTFVPSPEKKW
jgi:entry exclusion lipoprotein TrbK